MALNAGHYWQSLITRYGPPLEPESLNAETFELAVAERRALKVITQRDGSGGGYLYFCRAQIDDALKRGMDKWQNYCFCIVFPHPCEITDEEVEVLGHSYGPWERWEEVCEFTDAILRETPGSL
ncbi:hypothetical protein [Leptothoe sp. PORK10 BA2]|uniref:hypothetical protein n=1 Tax=Leptothoe sp. PORK10 BA2 TaxID=3110254 RepID=UPI002B21FD0A|nr:hypothetical protein [Leptothoe sp. PORK10 BA2]MEA5463800.1 hypothetical protein [Leptothoe sp. PORK10 BA2]